MADNTTVLVTAGVVGLAALGGWLLWRNSQSTAAVSRVVAPSYRRSDTGWQVNGAPSEPFIFNRR